METLSPQELTGLLADWNAGDAEAELVALSSALFFLHLNIFFPITSEVTAWYAGDFVLALAVALALAVYGFRISLGGRALFRGGLLED